MAATSTELDVAFPTPSLPPTILCPQRYPGTSPETVATLRHLLKDNHTKYHIFFDDRRLHNHISHRTLALYATGASGALIEHFYKGDSAYQRPAIDPPGAITEKNFIEHLGDDKYFAAYVTFFLKSIETNGVGATLDKYVFSKKYNFVEGLDASSQPIMLIRFLAGLIHPLIYAGYGTEFGIPGMIAEGLATASVHESGGLSFLTPSVFDHGSTTVLQETISRFATLSFNKETGSNAPHQPEQRQTRHTFSIFADIMQDPQFSQKSRADNPNGVEIVLSADIWRHVEHWTIDLSQPGEIERKIEECIWINTLIFAVGGWSKEKGFAANFFLMHLVTSSLFLPSLLPYLSQDFQVILLRAYLTTCFAWWFAQGGPRLDIQGFLDATAPPPLSEGDVVSEPNSFLDIIQSGMSHPNDHVLKIQRAFAHFLSIYGTRPRGYFEGTALEGADALDGSLFLRAARLTDDYMKGMRWSYELFVRD